MAWRDSNETCWGKVKELEDWEKLLALRDINDYQENCFGEMVRVEVRLLGVIKSFAEEVQRQ